ncbi:sensor histidine kinase [Peijinzhouia sedimentorum]
MKLHNQSLKYLSISILAIVTIWAAVFYVNMLGEIKSSIDEGLENYKRLIIQNAKMDSSILTKNYFDESFFSISSIEKQMAFAIKDRYQDTIIYMQDADDQAPEPEPVRMLTTAFEINGHYYMLKVANSMVEEDDLINELFWDVIWLYLILILGIVLTNNLVLKKLWRPFYHYLNQLKSYRLGSSEKLPEASSKTKEFTDLQVAVSTLLQHSITTFNLQKEFIGNASHELQTPLAMISNKLELLLENNDLSTKHAEKIAEIFLIVQRLIRLNKSLLLLSKIDNKQYFNQQQVSIDSIVHQVLHEIEDIATHNNIKISVSQASSLDVLIDPTLAHIVVSNLLKNAIVHNIENGTVEINFSIDSLSICNTGKDQGLDSQKAFLRFQKSGSETSGTGLGLAIVKAIVDLYEYPISYQYSNGIHCFTVRFVKS